MISCHKSGEGGFKAWAQFQRYKLTKVRLQTCRYKTKQKYFAVMDSSFHRGL